MIKQMLEVGDFLYTNRRFKQGLNKHIIDRVTNKRAFSGIMQFNRAIEFLSLGHAVRIIGAYGVALVETDDLKNQYRVQELISKAQHLRSSYTNDLIKTEEAANKIIALYESLKINP